MTTGLGKTRVVIHYIDYLIKNKLMPKYCVYTLPSEAISTVTEQFQEYSIPINIMKLTKAKDSNHDFLPWHVNFVFHDHLKGYGFPDRVLSVSHDTFFVVDECHKTMADSQKSSVALLIASSVKYLIAMTGTLIRDDEQG